MSQDSQDSQDSHHLIETRTPPDSLILFRTELANHKDIYLRAQKGQTFEEVIAIVAGDLNILLDGMYDVPDLCFMLYTALSNRSSVPVSNPSLLAPGLVDSEIIEHAKDLSLEIQEAQGRMIEGEKKFGAKDAVVLDTHTGEEKLAAYIICMSCDTWGDCCEHRTCKKGNK